LPSHVPRDPRKGEPCWAPGVSVPGPAPAPTLASTTPA
jgi:hypothetical protein